MRKKAQIELEVAFKIHLWLPFPFWPCCWTVLTEEADLQDLQLPGIVCHRSEEQKNSTPPWNMCQCILKVSLKYFSLDSQEDSRDESKNKYHFLKLFVFFCLLVCSVLFFRWKAVDILGNICYVCWHAFWFAMLIQVIYIRKQSDVKN